MLTGASERIVLDDSVTAAQVQTVAQTLAWTLCADGARSHDTLAHTQWETSDRQDVSYVEDHTGDVRFLEIAGTDAHTARSRSAIVREICHRLPTFDVRDLLRTAERSNHPRILIQTLSKLSVLRPPQSDARWLEVWRRALAHEDVVIRRAAIRTAYGCPWPEMRPLVEARIARDTRLQKPLRYLLSHLCRVSATGSRQPGS